jgi:hypothetical protein
MVAADGAIRELTTTAATVGEALIAAGYALDPADEVSPAPETALVFPVSSEPVAITIVRVTETMEVMPESIPFERRIVRSAEMSPEDPPRILQTGKAGLQEISLRIVYRDGLEAERWPTATTIIEEPVDEVIMIGVGSGSEAMSFAGRLAYISGGRAIILEGATDLPRQLSLSGELDGRVFQLSPDGDYLLYTAGMDTESEASGFRNELSVISTREGGEAIPLQIENVLWAGWDPAAIEHPRIAYTTARSVALPPGWEANNDLWLLELTFDDGQPAPVRLLETYPAAFGWWGGRYAWSPTGEKLAYAFAEEVGVLDLSALPASGSDPGLTLPELERTVLHTFPAFDTGAEWAWVPALSWSADGQTLAFTAYTGEADDRFDLWLADMTSNGVTMAIADMGIWSGAQWSPAGDRPASRLAFLRAAEPAAGQDSAYELWLADGDGDNGARLYPPAGETGLFGQADQSFVWGPDGEAIAFILDESLHILNPATGELFRAGEDDTATGRLTWAPYGVAVAP